MDTDEKIIKLFEKIEAYEMHDYDSGLEPEGGKPWHHVMEIASLVIYHGGQIDWHDLDRLYSQMKRWHPDHDMTEDIKYLRLNRLK